MATIQEEIQTAIDACNRALSLLIPSPPPPQPPSPTASISIDLNEIELGQSTTLHWTSTNGVSATLNGASVPLVGSMSVQPLVNTTYILIVSGQLNSVQATISLTVNQQPPPPPPPMPSDILMVASGQTVIINSTVEYEEINVEEGGNLELRDGCNLSLHTKLDCMGHFVAKGSYKTPYVRLAAPLLPGQTILELATLPENWKIGDKIAIPDSRQLQNPPTYETNTEECIITTINGRIISFTPALKYTHAGSFDGSNMPMVANLTRSIVVKSMDEVNRAHVIFHMGATVDSQNVLWEKLGVTTTDPNSLIGKYHVHFHMLGNNPVNFVGNVICGETIIHRWGIVIHATNHAIVRNNIVCCVAGAGIVCEDGTEKDNYIEDNLIFDIRGEGGRADSAYPGRDGCGIWLRSALQYVNRNKIFSCPSSAGIIIYGSNGITQMQNNEVCSCKNGFTFWYLSASEQKYDPSLAVDAVVKDFDLWNIHEWGYWNYPTNRLIIDGIKIRSNGGPSSIGLHYLDYLAIRSTVKRADIRGCFIGIVVPAKIGDTSVESTEMPFTIIDSYLDNEVNIDVTTPWSAAGGGASIPPRHVHIENVRYGSRSTGWNIALSYEPNKTGANVDVADRITVKKYNGVDGDDFGIYWVEKPLSPCKNTRNKILGYVC